MQRSLHVSPGRYARAVAVQQLDENGAERFALELRDPLTKDDLGAKVTVYTVKEGDRLDALAFYALGDSRMWWVLADLNVDVIEDTLRLTPGTRLLIPAADLSARRGSSLT